MKSKLTTTNQNAKLALNKSKSLLNITNSLLSKKANNNLEKQFKFRPFLIEEGHNKSVTALIVTSDGKIIISGSRDNTIKLWDIETGECLKTLKGHSGYIHSLAITFDGRQIVSGSLMETKIWDMQSGKCLQNIKQRNIEGYYDEDYITSSQVISANGNILVSSNCFGHIRVWNRENCNRIFNLEIKVGSSPILAISPDANIIAVAKGKLNRWGKIELWDVKKGKHIHTLNNHTNHVSALVIAPNNNLISGSWDETIRIWDIKSGKCLKVLEGQKSFLRTLAVTPDGNTLISSSLNPNIVKIWDLNTWECLKTIETRVEEAIAITPDGDSFVTEYGIWCIKTGKCLKKLKSSSSRYAKFLATPTKRKESFLLRDEHIKYGEINLYDNKNNYLKTLTKQDNWIQTLKIASIIEQIAGENSFFEDWIGIYSVKLLDTQNEKCILTIDTKNDIAIDNQGYFNASVESIEKWIRISESPLHQRKLTKHEISHFRKENDYLDIENLCIDKKENLHINNSDSSMRSYFMSMEPILITSDRKTLVTANGNGSLKIWDTQIGKCLKSLEGHSGFPKTIAITPDGGTIITSIVRDAYDGNEVEQEFIGDDGEEYVNTYIESYDEYEDNFEILLWDLKNGNYLGSLNSHISSVNTLSVSPDGKTLVSGSSHDKAYENRDNMNYGAIDYEIILWDIQNMKKIRTFYDFRIHTHDDSIKILKYTPNGKMIVSGSDDYTIKSWDIETGECLNTFKGHCGSINTLAITSDSQTIISGSDDYTIKLWDIETGKCFNTFTEHTNEIMNLQLTPNGKHIIVVSKKNIIKILDVKNGKCLKRIDDYNSSDFLLTINSDGNVTIAKENDQTIDIFDLYTGLKLYTINCNIDYDSIDKSIRVIEQPLEGNIYQFETAPPPIPDITIDEDEIPF